MIGDTQDMKARLRAALPARWFPDDTPVLDMVLAGLAATWAALYAMIGEVRRQSRLLTASGDTLDAISSDFFGTRLGRFGGETDQAFRSRLEFALRAEHCTRSALTAAVTSLTGQAPAIFEPSFPADTGSYSGTALAYGAAGGWGSLALPFQAFVTVRRPPTPGIALIAGYGTPGPSARINLSQAGAQIADADIMAAVAAVLPTASIAWTRITS